jgi:hypothetical protein
MLSKRKLEVESYKFISRGNRRCRGKNDYMFNDYLHELAPRRRLSGSACARAGIAFAQLVSHHLLASTRPNRIQTIKLKANCEFLIS